MRSILVITMLGTSLMTSACATKRGTGTAVGAVGGGLVGGALGGRTGALAGAALGGVAGYAVGKSIEDEDRRQMARAFELNQPVQWENPHTGYEYQVQPTRTIQSEEGRPCREFRMVADVEGRPDELYGTACRRPDGRWEVLSG